MTLDPDASWRNLWGLINARGWIAMLAIAAVAVGLYAIRHLGSPCENPEIREVEVRGEGRFVHGMKKIKYKVCPDESQP
jgi:hypothetical protein